MRRVGVSLVSVMALATAGCANGYGDVGMKEGAGTLLGAGTGALVGSQIGRGDGQLAAVAVGTLLGAFVGNQAGRSLDRADRAYAYETANAALESNPAGYESSWRNPDSGHYGSVTPVRTYQDHTGRYCREYSSTVYVGGRAEQAYGTACRQPDGSWQILS